MHRTQSKCTSAKNRLYALHMFSALVGLPLVNGSLLLMAIAILRMAIKTYATMEVNPVCFYLACFAYVRMAMFWAIRGASPYGFY